jgi:hypothetical protein
MQKITTYTIVLVMALIVVAGCKNSSGNNSVTRTANINDATQAAAANQSTSDSSTTQRSEGDGHNAKTSLDYMGTYQSSLPVSNDANVLFNLTLTQETYTMIVTSSGEQAKNKDSKTIKGTYIWDDTGQIITLNADTNMAQDTRTASLFNAGAFRLFVAENTLYHVDQNGTRIAGEQAEQVAFKKIID